MGRKVVNAYKFQRKVWHLSWDRFLKTCSGTMLPGVQVLLTVPDTANCFTRPTSTAKVYTVNIGLDFPHSALGYGSCFNTLAEACTYVGPLHRIYSGATFHEFGHIRYTDMDSDLIWTYKDQDKVYFIANLSNIIEDICIENFGMAKEFPHTKKYFDYMVKKIFLPKVSAVEDNGDMQSFLNFLLYKLRCGKAMAAAGKTNAVWTKYGKSILPLLLDCFKEADAHQRLLKEIKLAEWIIANVPEVDWNKPKPTDTEEFPWSTSSSGGSSGNTPSPTKPTSGAAGAGGGAGAGSKPGEFDPHTEFKTQDNDSSGHDASSFDPLLSGDLDQVAPTCADEQYDPKKDVPIEDLPEAKGSFSSKLGGDDDHVWLDAPSYFEPNPDITAKIDELVTAQMPVATGISVAFHKFTAHIKPRLTPGFRSGRLDVKSVIRNNLSKSPSLKVFAKRVPGGIAPDVCFSILCDNSGSMCGNKARITTRAMIAFAKACDMCNLPCEVNLFCDGLVNQTTTIKSFDQTFDEAKPYFGIAHSDFFSSYKYDCRSIQTFSGNVDEVNLHYVWERLKKNKHKDRIVIVISDGYTCGSTEDLSNEVKRIIREGGYVIGIGIQSRAVLDVYPNVKIFESAESLKQLPEFMTNMVMNIITGKE